eukprot:TRINITY_DN6740_c0_g1_i2.p1 TRINITY_DN6740_c0_g1~~TRINITY_DN6740_c0_g1_i2.p1  ORF type:complete len:115 (-),score=12.49 TRINITY_DN6740_c0_g1_i2:62-406(-)
MLQLCMICHICGELVDCVENNWGVNISHPRREIFYLFLFLQQMDSHGFAQPTYRLSKQQVDMLALHIVEMSRERKHAERIDAEDDDIIRLDHSIHADGEVTGKPLQQRRDAKCE